MTSIIQLTDNHLFKDSAKNIGGSLPNQNLAACIEKIACNVPDYFILTGDVSEDCSPESYLYIAELISQFETPVYWVAGNHDNEELMTDIFKQFFWFQKEKIIELANWDIILADTYVAGKVYGLLAEEELGRIRALIQKSKKNIAIFMHHPPVKTNRPEIDSKLLLNQKALWQITDKNDKVQLVACGHAHNEYLFKHSTINIEVTPATAFQVMEHDDDVIVSQSGYKVFNFNEKDYFSETVWLDR